MTQPHRAALAGFILWLPGTILLTLLVLGIEPNFGRLQPLLTAPAEGPHVVGSLIALGLIGVLPVAALITNLVPIRRTMRAGGRLFAHPVNVVLAVATLITITAFIAGIIIDQYPCWMGVPNCD